MFDKKTKNTKVLQLYFDMDDPVQGECYELISKLSRKKSRFIANLVNDFLTHYPEATDKKALSFFVEHYDELKKYKIGTEQPTIVRETVVTHDNNEDKAAEDNVNNNQAIAQAMDMFTA